MEENLIEIAKLKEEKDKQLLTLEYALGFSASITFLTLIFVASYIEMTELLKIILIILAFIIFMVGCFYSIKIEQIAGYYKCGNCDYKYIPKYKSVFFSPHMGRTRYMKCPKCNKKSWNKKVLTK